MKIAIMQPYVLPYIGYFQLISAVDKFVVYDDVTFIKQGWINRNKILLNGKEFLFNLQLSGASSFKLINEIEIGLHNNKTLKTIEQAYLKAPYFKEVFPVIAPLFIQEEKNLGKYLFNQLSGIAKYLDIKTEFLLSSDIEKDNTLKAQDKVIEICKKLNGTVYINAIGGQELYSKADFKAQNMDLFFIKTKPVQYRQFNFEFTPWLSIVDILMFNSKETVQGFLNEYELL